MPLHISTVLNSFGSTLDSGLVSCTGSDEEAGCSLHVTNRFPIDPDNPRRPVLAPSSASIRWRRGRSLAWSRHTSHCTECSKDSSSRRIKPTVCPVFTFVPSHPTIFMFCVFAFSSFRLATNDSVMSLLEPDCGVVWLKYEEPGSATMLMCSSVRVFMWYLLSTPRTCFKV